MMMVTMMMMMIEDANADADLLGVLLLQLLSPVALFYCLALPLVDEPFDQNRNTFPRSEYK